MHLKKSKLVNFCVAILILKMEREKQHFKYLCYIISRKVQTYWNVKKKKWFVQCMEKVLWLIERDKNGLWYFVLQIFHWKVLHGWVGQLKLLLLLLLATQFCLTLCDPMDCSPPGSSVVGFFRQEYWSMLPFPSPEDLPWPRDQTHVSCSGRQILYNWATREALSWSWQQSNWDINWEQSMLYLMGDKSKYPNHSLKIICTS